ncbi:hypothetical protein BPAE_0435g00040 [Botrytis paeoniae]|uniref:Uncharacterized protein n=1 Tax=Botrytis paeoniae TaxID=278948 RepID=A0A4Z1F177_9HELO|nr:hypothetical protein BPAE_0435g00040 [Botrytis paeoniae]
MKPNNNEVAGKNSGQMSTQSKYTLAQTQHAIREHQKQIEEFQIKIQEYVQQIAALRQEEQALLKEQAHFEVEKLQRELCDIDKENGKREVEEIKDKDMMAKQMQVYEVLYEGEF